MCVQRSWVGASKKQCEELLEFIRHLAEDDKEGVMAVKVNYSIVHSPVTHHILPKKDKYFNLNQNPLQWYNTTTSIVVDINNKIVKEHKEPGYVSIMSNKCNNDILGKIPKKYMYMYKNKGGLA